MESGFINQKIQIFTYDDVDDGAGGSSSQRVLYWETKAKVQQIKARKTLLAVQEKLNPSALFTVRYRADKFITEDMVIEWRGQTFAVQMVEPDYVYKQTIDIVGVGSKIPVR